MSFQNVVGWFIIKAINDQSPVAFFSEKSRFLHMRYLKFDYSVQKQTHNLGNRVCDLGYQGYIHDAL